MSFTEVEFKYRADGVDLSAFKAFCIDKKPKNSLIASGFDYFYSNEKETDSFFRLRVSPSFNQLTYKKKTNDNNNYVRTEHNIDLQLSLTKEQAEAFVGEFGYEYNTTIYKNAFIYFYDYYTLVYYVCYDEGMKELGRFIEIELDENQDFGTQESAWSELTILEKLCKPIGITAQARIKKSLYEMFSKEVR